MKILVLGDSHVGNLQKLLHDRRGFEYHCESLTGSSTESWLTDHWHLVCTIIRDNYDAYIICLGSNDSISNTEIESNLEKLRAQILKYDGPRVRVYTLNTRFESSTGPKEHMLTCIIDRSNPDLWKENKVYLSKTGNQIMLRSIITRIEY